MTSNHHNESRGGVGHSDIVSKDKPISSSDHHSVRATVSIRWPNKVQLASDCQSHPTTRDAAFFGREPGVWMSFVDIGKTSSRMVALLGSTGRYVSR